MEVSRINHARKQQDFRTKVIHSHVTKSLLLEERVISFVHASEQKFGT